MRNRIALREKRVYLRCRVGGTHVNFLRNVAPGRGYLGSYTNGVMSKLVLWREVNDATGTDYRTKRLQSRFIVGQRESRVVARGLLSFVRAENDLRNDNEAKLLSK